ncbi:MAG: hypothetical protein WD467_01495 [Candidatus Saccharimonadales bacterium]
MSKQRKLSSYPLFYEQVPAEVPVAEQPLKRRPGRKPKFPRLPEDNVLENLEQ